MIAIRLNKNIQCEHICQQIQKLISEYKAGNNLNDSVITISITTCNDSQVRSPTYYIEHKDVAPNIS